MCGAKAPDGAAFSPLTVPTRDVLYGCLTSDPKARVASRQACLPFLPNKLSSFAEVSPTRELLLSTTRPSRAPPDFCTRQPSLAAICCCNPRSPAAAAVCCCTPRSSAAAALCCYCCSCCYSSFWFCIVRFASIHIMSAIVLSEWLTPPGSSCPPAGRSDLAEPSCDIGTTGINH